MRDRAAGRETLFAGPRGERSARTIADRAAMLEAELAHPGGLSIIVQGALLRSDAERLAKSCAMWRDLFPAAQLICAISSSDCVAQPPALGGPIVHLRPLPHLADDPHLSAALEAIQAQIDLVVFGRAQQPLPPIKSDSPGPNNINLMIAAAQAGLSWASGTYVLRIRNDLLLRDAAFVRLYVEGLGLPRGAWSLFAQRVMVPEVFTLNPLTLSHMPFHYSDWFHFGLTGDVRRLWQPVQPMSLEDATFYESQPHLPQSNLVERRFRSRLAPEQVVSFPVFKQAFNMLQLDCHNDLTNLEESLLALADNFVVANLADCNAAIDKYQHIVDRMSTYTRLECMSQSLVEQRAVHPDVPARTLFARLLRRTARFESQLSKMMRGVRRALVRRIAQYLRVFRASLR